MPFKTAPDPAFSSKSRSTSTKPPSSTPTSTKPVFFWRPASGHGYLSQWYPSPFTVDGATYATAEMWMMVQKAHLFNDSHTAAAMLDTTDPKEHRRLGRLVERFDAAVWDAEKLRIVEQGTNFKFTASEDAERLRAELLGTGERELVEASPFDRVWGVGFGEKDAQRNRVRWGENLLGRALMSVRARLREEEEGKKKVDGE